jgi:hypothetical protein
MHTKSVMHNSQKGGHARAEDMMQLTGWYISYLMMLYQVQSICNVDQHVRVSIIVVSVMGRMERKLMVVLYFIFTPISWGG